MKRIMFVCTGNTCRSPMAEAILKAMLKEKSIAGIKVSSAGISAVPGQPIMANANAALRELGFKAVKHAAKQLTREDVQTYDLIVCMTEHHKRYLGGSGNITTVAAITGLHDVDDPYGDSLETYVKTAGYLKYACGDILNIITKALAEEEKEKAPKEPAKREKPLKTPETPKRTVEKQVKLKMKPGRRHKEGKGK